LKSTDIACLDDFCLLPGNGQFTQLSDPTVSARTEKQGKKTPLHPTKQQQKKVLFSEEYSEVS